MSAKYIWSEQTPEQLEAEAQYKAKNAHFGNLFLLDAKRRRLVANTRGVVLEIASGCLPTLAHYAANNNKNELKTIVFSEPMPLAFDVGLKTIIDMIDNQSDIYTGSYEQLSTIKDANGCPVRAWKFIFTEMKDETTLRDDQRVPLNIPCYYIQSALTGVGDLVRQVLPAGTALDTVVSSFGVCYVCCSVHPLDYLCGLQTILGPKKSDNTYRLCMLEHGQTKHPGVNPAENQWVMRDGGVAFRHLFELVADARLIIHSLEHHPETNEPDVEKSQTFHIYEAEPNDQSEWVKKHQQVEKQQQ